MLLDLNQPYWRSELSSSNDKRLEIFTHTHLCPCFQVMMEVLKSDLQVFVYFIRRQPVSPCGIPETGNPLKSRVFHSRLPYLGKTPHFWDLLALGKRGRWMTHIVYFCVLMRFLVKTYSPISYGTCPNKNDIMCNITKYHVFVKCKSLVRMTCTFKLVCDNVTIFY